MSINNEPTKQDECRWCRGLCCEVADTGNCSDHQCECGGVEHDACDIDPIERDYYRDEVQS